jgi:uncharacterized protein (TIGR00295 family)
MNESGILNLLETTGCPADVIDHCRSVAALSRTIAERITGCDPEKAYLGGLIHDIGRSISHGIIHAVEGARIAKEKEVPQDLVNIILTHIGAGITADEAPALGLPAQDYMPETLEEKVVAHADNLLSGTKRRPFKKLLRKLEKKGTGEAVKERFRALHRELSRLADIDLDLI